jgi:ATP-binding cassette subfamily B multidrug efflux pump
MAKNVTKDDEILEAGSKTQTILKLLAYLKEYKLKIFIVILLMVYVMCCELFNPYLLEIAIDKFIATKNLKGLFMIGAIMLCLNFIAMFAGRKRIKIMNRVTNKILLDIRHQLYTHIQKLSFSFFDNRPVGKILARVIGDVNSLQDLFNNSVTNFIPDLLNLICVTVIMLAMNYKLALATMCILPLLIIGMGFIETFSRRRWQKFRKKTSNLNAYTHENFSGIRVIQSFAEEKRQEKNYENMVKDWMDSFISAVRLNDAFWPMTELSWGIGSVVVFIFSVGLIKNGDLTVGTLVAFLMYIGMFWRPIMNISNFYNTLITNLTSAERIFEILSIEPDIVSIDEDVKMPKIKGKVEFKNVTFAYDENQNVLNSVNFKINPGETIALVGPTGAGKTTIVNLISRFYDTPHGEVLIDGINVKDVNLESLRSQMGIMLQDTFLFSTTIMENIRYGKLDATDKEVMEAAKAVNAHEFIMKFEKGYQTEVSERGSRLSVGQRQLISFARALLANPRILILDEATSNIDTFTERLVQRGIQKLLHGRTAFVIAHRLSTIRDCDRIMVIDDGMIAESGTHEELMKIKGRYYELYVSQYKFLSEGA